MYPITTLVSALLSLVYIYLSVKVILLRHQHKVSIGAEGHSDLEMAIRAHGNFAEYVSITLILLLCAEANNGRWVILIPLALLFVVGRLFHAYAFLYNKNHFRFRLIGMSSTFTAMACLAILNLLFIVIKS